MVDPGNANDPAVIGGIDGNAAGAVVCARATHTPNTNTTPNPNTLITLRMATSANACCIIPQTRPANSGAPCFPRKTICKSRIPITLRRPVTILLNCPRSMVCLIYTSPATHCRGQFERRRESKVPSAHHLSWRVP